MRILLYLLLAPLFVFAQGEQRYANGTATDQDGNSFKWINYGTQDWAIENAEVVTYRDGTEIPQVTDDNEWESLTTGAWCYVDNDPAKGKLYNWYAVMGIHDTDPNTPNKEFAPEGWYVPTDTDWTILENYLIANGYNYDGTTTGNKIAKAMASTTGWNSSTRAGAPGNDQSTNNSSGFDALPWGLRTPAGGYPNEGSLTVFWSSTEDDTNSVWARNVARHNKNPFLYTTLKDFGFSVRFVRDTSSAGSYGILLNGTVSAENNQIKNVADPTEAQDAVTLAYINQIEFSNDDLQEQVDNLQAQIDELRNIQNLNDVDGDGFNELEGDCNDSDSSINPNAYEIRDGIDNNCDGEIDEGYQGLSYPEDVDGNTYDFAIYGNQYWTLENAEMVTYRDGTPIPEITDLTEWLNLTTGAWCYYDNDPAKEKLYNWYAAAGIHDNDPNTPNKELAPEGWHVPSEAEWTNLENHLIVSGYNYDGTNTVNLIAKSMASITGWLINFDTVGTPGYLQNSNNLSGFEAFPVGGRGSSGRFLSDGSRTWFWSSTEIDTNDAVLKYIGSNNVFLSTGTYQKIRGFSVRFVRD
jgi:uncharacterized protein (TIGR02145 family)